MKKNGTPTKDNENSAIIQSIYNRMATTGRAFSLCGLATGASKARAAFEGIPADDGITEGYEELLILPSGNAIHTRFDKDNVQTQKTEYSVDGKSSIVIIPIAAQELGQRVMASSPEIQAKIEALLDAQRNKR